MSEKVGPFQVVDLSQGRRVMINMLGLAGSKRSMYGLLEVDVTAVRRIMAKHKARTRESLSFTGYMAFCLGRALDEHKELQAYLKGHKQMVLFEDVDVGLMVEGKKGDKRALMGHVIRKANRKTYRQIHQEIRSIQAKPVPSNRGLPEWFRRAMLLPWPLSKLFKALITLVVQGDPTILVEMGGTVGISSIGMFGEGHSGWGIFPLTQSLGLLVGSISWKPTVIAGRIEPREILNLTVMFDHEIVDGGPAARFTQRLIQLIESCYGLDEFEMPVRAYYEAETII